MRNLVRADDQDRQRLEREFHTAIYTTYEQGAERGYYPTRFLQMIEEHGAVETAKRLLADSTRQSGLYRLWELRLLADSVEAIVLQERFAPLFTRAELAQARRRLSELGYPKS